MRFDTRTPTGVMYGWVRLYVFIAITFCLLSTVGATMGEAQGGVVERCGALFIDVRLAPRLMKQATTSHPHALVTMGM